MYRFRGDQRRAELGTFPPLALGEARDMARQVWAEIQRGNDPKDTLRWLKSRQADPRSVTTAGGPFSEMCRRYLDERRGFLRTATHQLYSRLIERHIVPAFGTKSPADVTRTDVKGWIERLKITPTQAN